MERSEQSRANLAEQIEMAVFIKAAPDIVWQYLTEPAKMQKWMGDPEMHVEVLTDWIPGHAIRIQGFHHIPFENKGMILEFVPGKCLRYSHLSSLSRLSDSPENYTFITFSLHSMNNGTPLEICLENFPTPSIYNHLALYWRGTAEVLKRVIESETCI